MNVKCQYASPYYCPHEMLWDYGMLDWCSDIKVSDRREGGGTRAKGLLNAYWNTGRAHFRSVRYAPGLLSICFCATCFFFLF